MKQAKDCYYCGFPTKKLHKRCGMCPTCCECQLGAKVNGK